MRLARKLVLLVALALSASALSVGTASGTEPIEILDGFSNHCNPCAVHVVGEMQISVPGVGPVSTCESELVAEVHEDGTGHITDVTTQNHAGLSCTTQKCNGIGEPAAETEWPFQIEETGAGQESLDVRFCIDPKSNPNGTGLHCDAHAGIVDLGGYSYGGSLVNQPCAGGARIVNGELEVEGVPVRIDHPDA